MGRIIRRTLMALLIVASLMTAAVVCAAVQVFDGKGEWNTNDDDNQTIAMARAKQRAQLDAQKKAGVYLKTFSRAIDSELTDDEISAVTNNIIELVGDVHYDKKLIPLSEQQTTLLYTATLKAKIDPDGISDWLNRDAKDKVTIVQQNNTLQDAASENDKLAADLTEQYQRAKTQEEKANLRKQMEQADRDFLANQKLEEGLKLYYAKDYSGAIRLYNEAIELNPNLAMAYNNRGEVFRNLAEFDEALQDFNRAIKLNPRLDLAYNNRGNVYQAVGQYEQAFNDYNRAIELNPQLAMAYNNRGELLRNSGQFDKALQDFNRAIELAPNFAIAYNNRGLAYTLSGNLNQGVADSTKALQLEPNYPEAYTGRALAYALAGNFQQAIDDTNKAIQLNPNLAVAYYLRGVCYQELGNTAQAQDDLIKAKELGYDG